MLNSPIEALPGTSVLTIKRLKTAGINTFWDLLNYFPFRHEDRTATTPIFSLQEGDHVTVRGTVMDVKNEFTRRGMKIQKVNLKDETGTVTLTWFNQYYIVTTLKPGMEIAAWGEVKKSGNTMTMTPQEFEILDARHKETIHMFRLVPVYPAKKGLSSKTIREKVWYVVGLLRESAEETEYMPEDIVKEHELMAENDAYLNIHFPPDKETLKRAQVRLAFDELFIIHLATALVKREWAKEKVGHRFDMESHREAMGNFMKRLPFELTAAQQKVTNDILRDLQKQTPMNRFLQGDVGSGKTVVAAVAAYLSQLNGFQTLVMAPTEILAQQHYMTLNKLFTEKKIRVALQTSSHKTFNPKKKEESKDYDIIVGTHALLNQSLDFKNVGLVIIDEQHRFGVRQRALLKDKGINPHLLTMTATPIPRTVALTLFGELDISVIDEMPKNRLPIKSYVVPTAKRYAGYEWITKQVKEHGDQVYIICPLIEESEIESMKSVRAAVKEFEHLQKNVFPSLKLGLLHGKMKSDEKHEVMRKFKEKEFDILVSTSVVEVGIDVPNATIIMIEGAERFGMAQLHQLRGRVGRGDKQSYCYLYATFATQESSKRLQFFAEHNKGIDIAEYDLQLRGTGDMYGTRQSGTSDLAIANLSDLPMIEKTKHVADSFIADHNIDEYPALKKRIADRNITEIARD